MKEASLWCHQNGGLWTFSVSVWFKTYYSLPGRKCTAECCRTVWPCDFVFLQYPMVYGWVNIVEGDFSQLSNQYRTSWACLQPSELIASEGVFTGLHTQKAYTHTCTSSSQCVHQTLCHLFMHIHLSFCWSLMHICNYTWCTHWLSNCNFQVKCIYAWADNIRNWGDEVPVWVYALRVCKPVNYSKCIDARAVSIYCREILWNRCLI